MARNKTILAFLAAASIVAVTAAGYFNYNYHSVNRDFRQANLESTVRRDLETKILLPPEFEPSLELMVDYSEEICVGSILVLKIAAHNGSQPYTLNSLDVLAPFGAPFKIKPTSEINYHPSKLKIHLLEGDANLFITRVRLEDSEGRTTEKLIGSEYAHCFY